MTTVDATYSQVSVTTWAIHLSVSFKNISEGSNGKGGVYTSSVLRIRIWVWTSVHRYMVRQETDMYSYRLNFPWNYFLVFVVDERSAIRPGRLTPKKELPVTITDVMYEN
jgi:hypothetical protein